MQCVNLCKQQLRIPKWMQHFKVYVYTMQDQMVLVPEWKTLSNPRTFG